MRAALHILKAYIDEGKPKQDIPQYGSFEEWSDWVRSALVWLDMADPNLTRKRIEQNDPVKMNLSRIINLWDKLYSDADMKVSEIVADCNDAIDKKDFDSPEFELAQAFLEATRSRARTLNGRSIGIWLRSNKERIQDGYKIVPSPWSKKSSVQTWVLEKVK